ncbi:ABC transporter permease [Candidatus Mycoplasma mahonii]|uniref:ABC transporter permease n=1 Tax=Candidatus Mycoplasma mahonii TaxID=3004105 RepID=UPI0026EFADE0|nr:ABC transporter permease [Candidatus Mycoplasma mahonii]WKX02255.1 ABC transporter permease [Candidatus Mycoplasma mahonii]
MIIITTGILLAVVLSIAATAGMFSEKSGTVNIAINGMMVGGALVYWLLSKSFDLKGPMQIVGYLIAMLSGIIIGGLFGFATITLKANQIIAGTAMNLLFGALGLFMWKYKGGTISSPMNFVQWRVGGEKYLTSDFNYVFGLILLIGILVTCFSWAWLKLTPWGLRFKAAGENPQALDSQGINVVKTRYYGVLISGVLATLAGAMYAQVNKQFDGNVAGLGFIALALMIAGQWNVIYIFVAAFAFGMLYSVGQNIAVYQKSMQTYQALIQIIPFIISIGILVATSKKSRAPKAAGVAYDKGKR